MIHKLWLAALVAAFYIPCQAQGITGTWEGTLQVASQKLVLYFRFGQTDSGTPTCHMDIPAQSVKGMAVRLDHISADSVSLSVPAIAMTYAGKLQGERIVGTFHQGMAALPLQLKRGQIAKPNRPQEPKPPFRYTTQEVTFANPSAGITLAGTLTYPVGFEAKKRVPVVVMATGSGPENRDEEIFDHKPFAVLAHHLALNGIASLRFDDRGVGKSTGQQQGATTDDFATDVKAGIDYLRSLKCFNRIGVLGHSEGGLIAFMLAADGACDFIVSMAGPGIKGDTLLTEQLNRIMQQKGIPTRLTVAQTRASQAAKPGNEWMKHFLDFDPAPVISRIRIPVIAINGSKDCQVLAASNLTAIRQLLAPKGNKHNLIRQYDGLNHLFQHCQTGSGDEYYQIEETIAPEVLRDIAEWINSL